MEVTATSGANGVAPMPTSRESISSQLEELIGQTRERYNELQAEADAVRDEMKTYEQALARLRGQKLGAGGKVIGRPVGRPPKKSPESRKNASVGTERLVEIERQVRLFAAEHDEFRQIDIRTKMGGLDSSSATYAFERLRQAGVIRLARKQGNNKYFRLTAEALRDQTATDADS